MPIYEYRCTKGHTFEVTQRMTDDPLADCSTCGRPVQRVFHPVAVHFKGKGFYTTDYGKRSKSGSADGSSSKSDSDSGGGKSESGDSSKSKSSTKTESSKSSSDSSKSS